jgi:hypothetical protein
LQGGVPAALHCVALLGKRILCAVATRFAPVGWPGGPTLCGCHRSPALNRETMSSTCWRVNP